MSAPVLMPVCIVVNGEERRLAVAPWETLLHVLRDRLFLTGTKECCGEGECGACTVMLDGRTVDSCIVLAVEADGHEVTTIEGLSSGGRLHPVQEAFLESGAVQCGFCTPGMILSAVQLLQSNPNPTADDVKEGLCGNLCRCTGYTRIVQSVLSAAEVMRNNPEQQEQ